MELGEKKMEVLGLVTDRRDGDGDGKVRKEDEEEEAEERKEERVTMADEMVVVIMVMDGCWPIHAHPKHARRGMCIFITYGKVD
ncbi:hypothetical protein F9C07_10862 [Aspergillus flavus]|uniref:Uncharacterized protein n=1 Tax=Aspergillus flavus (strain ATCC 200026 / FGSC A1120 / IAM 13836 / NRRL 3357 / JCM 12722 / SRRC 167) TaxID=332952 RepID=A0A7U2MS10_ASPFN|nr:hypothetical protein F9C07_10862 [Aspergillus flavus]